MMKLFSSRLFAFLMTFVLMTVMLSSFNLSFALDDEQPSEESDVSYDENNNPYRSGQLIVGYNRNAPEESRRSLRAEMQLELKTKLHGVNADVIKVKNERAREVLSQLKKNPNVAFAEYDYLASIDYSPNDPKFPYQLYLPYMNTPEAWDYTKGSANITIAVLDTGIITNNTDIKDLNLTGFNIVESTADYTDDNGHGTAVTSVIAGKMDNNFGFAGIAPDCPFMILKVIGSDGSGTYSDMIRGIEFAANTGAKVINMSMGGRADSDALKLAVDNTVNKGVTIVAAAGNEGSTIVSFPAAYSNVVGVGAVDSTGSKMSFSNTGSGLTVVAGGSAMIATGTDYISSATGTSFASPYVAGMVALMYSVDNNMNPDKVFDILSQTSTDLGSKGYDTTFGYGVVNMGEAVRMASGSQATAPEPEPEPVVDTTPPVLTLIGDSSITLEQGNKYSEQGAKAIDDVDGDISSNVVISGSVNMASAGVYMLTYSVTDEAGNKSNIETRTVEIVEPVSGSDETPPVLTLVGDSYMSLELGESYNEPGAEAIDDVDGDISSDIVITGSVDETSFGIYELTYSVMDQAGNKSNAETRTVEIIEIVDIPPETHFIRDVEIIKGSLNKKNPVSTHVIQVTDPGQLDVELSYLGKEAPQLSITGLDFSGASDSFEVTVDNYTMTLNSKANIKYSVTLTYPEREVPVGVPAGPPEVIIYEVGYDYMLYIYLAIAIMIIFTVAFLYKTDRIRHLRK